MRIYTYEMNNAVFVSQNQDAREAIHIKGAAL
jgi:hypothetical protein